MTASPSASLSDEPELLVLGALHVDEVATMHAEMVAGASNPVSWRRLVGGVASNAARAAHAHFSYKGKGSVTLHAALGNDMPGDALQKCLLDAGIHLTPHVVKESVTGRYSAIMSNTGELILGLADVQLAQQLPPRFAQSAMQNNSVDALLLDANLSDDCIAALIKCAKQTSIPVAAMTVSPSKAIRFLPMAAGIEILFCNRLEALALAQAAGLVSPKVLAAQQPLQNLGVALTKIGFRQFVLTDGASDLLIGDNTEYTMLAINPVKPGNSPGNTAGNVNGAGDALAGASVAAFCLGCTLIEAVTEYGLGKAASVICGEHSPLSLNREGA